MEYIKKYQNLYDLNVQSLIREENKNKAGIYMIHNLVNNKRYIGCASTNRINVRFRNHFFHFSGSKLTSAAIQKYGIENFHFYILEYFPGFVKKEDLSTAHIELLKLETKYIEQYKPEYNILQQGTSSLGYRHTEETKRKLRENYSQERKDFIGDLNRGRIFSDQRRRLLSEIATLRNTNKELRDKLSGLASKPVSLYDKNGSLHSNYSGIRAMAKTFNCCNKTINRYIKSGKIFKGIGIIRLDQTGNRD
jgi:group I intron endonuclease